MEPRATQSPQVELTLAQPCLSYFGELLDSFLSKDGKALQLFLKKEREREKEEHILLFYFFNNMKC